MYITLGGYMENIDISTLDILNIDLEVLEIDIDVNVLDDIIGKCGN